MDEGDAAELRALRLRAYGRGADITDDPRAVRRLAELEAAERVVDFAAPGDGAAEPGPPADGAAEPSPPVNGAAEASATGDESPAAASLAVDAVTPGDRRTGSRADAVDAEPGLIDGVPAGYRTSARATPDAAPGSEVPRLSQTSDGATESSATEASAPEGESPAAASLAVDDLVAVRPRRWRRVVVGLAWAASLALVAAVAATYTAAVTARTAVTATTIRDDADITYVTTLMPDSTRELPHVEMSTAHENFFGLIAVAADQSWRGVDETCLYLMLESDWERSVDDPAGGWSSFGSCTYGGFPATAQFLLDRNMGAMLPDELFDEYPEGTAFQFVLHEVGVDVFVSAAASGPSVEP